MQYHIKILLLQYKLKHFIIINRKLRKSDSVSCYIDIEEN